MEIVVFAMVVFAMVVLAEELATFRGATVRRAAEICVEAGFRELVLLEELAVVVLREEAEEVDLRAPRTAVTVLRMARINSSFFIDVQPETPRFRAIDSNVFRGLAFRF